MRIAIAALLLSALPAAVEAQRISTPEDVPVGDRRISVGEAQRGELTTSHPIAPDDTYVEGWAFRSSAGQTVTFDLMSDDFDSFMILVGPGVSTADDDGGGACHSRITQTFEEDGDYVVIVNTIGEGQVGAYVLRASTDPPPPSDESCGGGPDFDFNMNFDDDRFPPADVQSAPIAGQLAIGGSVSGRLTGGGPTIGGRPAHVYEVQATAGALITVEVRSDAFDTYVGFWTPGATTVDSDDDGGSGTNSCLSVEIPFDGAYRLVASVFSSGGGSYVVSATEGGDCFTGRARRSTLEALPIAGDLEMGGEIVGWLAEEDDLLENGAPAHAYSFTGEARTGVTFEVRSESFDTYLFVTGPGLSEMRTDDDGGQGSNSCLGMVLPASGTYRVVVSSFTPDQGNYVVSAVAGDECFTGRARTSTLANLPIVDELGLDGETPGRLEPGDEPLENGTWADAYAFTGEAGQAVTFGLRSDAFDTYLFVVGPGLAEPMRDDDGGQGTNSCLSVVLPASGTYRVIASSFVEAEGAYLVSATEGDDCFTGRARRSTLEGLPVAGELGVPGEATGRLEAGDATTEDGHFADAYVVAGRAGEAATFEVGSDAYDAYMFVVGPGLTRPLSNDDGGPGTDSCVSLTFPETGTYRVIATSYSEARGPYRVVAYEGDECFSGRARTSTLDNIESSGELLVGGAVVGQLEPGDGETDEGHFADAYTMAGEPGRVVTVDLSGDFDTYLFITGPGVTQLSNDDGGAGTGSCIRFTQTSAGPFRVIASSFSSGREGNYMLRALDGGSCSNERSQVVGWDQIPVYGRLELGGEITGTLGDRDIQTPERSYGRAYLLSGRANQNVTIDLASSEFDAYLRVLGPGLPAAGESDRDAGGACNARVTLRLPESGDYRVVVTTEARGEMGAYSLRLGDRAGPVNPASCS